MVLRETKKFLHKNGTPRKFYGCTNFPKCKGTHGAHPSGDPLGVPANLKTKNARIKAHDVFDRFWKEGHVSRAYAYQIVSEAFGRQIHIGELDFDGCERLVKFCEGEYGTLAAKGKPSA
ncbi:MAG: hypothetical protein HQK96_07670 [Nitrospirae bacterium]|nr:hypothetical protein [Nitrospirota bacterium]